MKKCTEIYSNLFLALLIIYLAAINCQNANIKYDNSDKSKGFEFIYVIDVSWSLNKFNENKDILTKFITLSFDTLINIEKDDLHLITFSETAFLFDSVKFKNKDLIISTIINEIEKNKNSKYTFPKHGLGEVFDLVEDNFPQKTGIILFLSDGEYSHIRYGYDFNRFEKTIKSLKNNGFSLFSIYIKADKGRNTEASEKNMRLIAEWANTLPFYEINKQEDIYFIVSSLKQKILITEYCSPVSRNDFNKFESNFWRTAISAFSILIIILIVIVVLIINFRKRSNITYESSIDINLLWGVFKNNKNANDLIDLSDKSIGAPIKMNDEFSLVFYPFNFKNRKVINARTVDGGRIEYFDKDGTQCVNQHIDAETDSIKIIHPKDPENFVTYSYKFLNKLGEDFSKPVNDPSKLLGRDDIIREIMNNFLKGDSKEKDHYLISGMGNVGKTSFIKQLFENFKKDNRITKNYKNIAIGFNDDHYNNIDELKKHLEAQINFNINSERKHIIFIDDYDQLFDYYGDDFAKLFYEYHHDKDIYFVLSGQKDFSLMDSKYASYFPKPNRYDTILLSGIDNINYSKDYSSHTFLNSLKLIDITLSDIGLRTNFLDEKVKKYIVYLTSGFPYLIKRMLDELIKIWLDNYSKKNLTIEDVKGVSIKLIKPSRQYLIDRAIYLDEKKYDKLEDRPASHVLIRDIIGALIEDSNSECTKEKIENLLVNEYNKEIHKLKKDNFANQITKLKSMGFLIEDGNNLIGIPFLIYLSSGETN